MRPRCQAVPSWATPIHTNPKLAQPIHSMLAASRSTVSAPAAIAAIDPQPQRSQPATSTGVAATMTI